MVNLGQQINTIERSLAINSNKRQMNPVHRRLLPIQILATFGTWFLLGVLMIGSAYSQSSSGQPDFNRDVRPILAAKCFTCHGPDEQARESDLRLDSREQAIKSGAIIARESSASEMITRIHATGDQQMPPLDSGKTLSAKEKKS